MRASGPSPRAFLVDRRWAVVAVVLLVVESLIAGLLFFEARSGGAPQQTVWQQITSGVTADGRVPKDVALEAFAYLYRVNIPGVTVPGGVDGGDAPTSGTGAMRWVMSNWDQLTPDQQAVINRYRTAGPNDLVIHIDATTGSTPTRLAPVRPGPLTGVLAVDQPLADAMKAELLADINHIGPKLGMPVIAQGILFKDITLTLSDTDGGNTLFTTLALQGPLKPYSPCNVTAWKNAWSGQGVTNGKVSDFLHVTMTHEVVHCYQNVVWGSTDTGNAIPSFITEGTALWLAGDDTGIEEPMLPSMWKNGWFGRPETALTNRTYDAFGYYALLDHLGRNLWGLMANAWKAAAA